MGLPLAVEPDPDAELLDGCRRGDAHAQRALFDRHRDRVYSIALHYLRGDEAAANDVSQEVFVKLFRALSTFRAESRLSTWLYRVVANAWVVTRQQSGITLRHLIQRVEGGQRERVLDRLVALSPPPANVTMEGIRELDRQMLDRWRRELNPMWGEEAAPLWTTVGRRLWMWAMD